jgi:hypothetical protein
MSEKKKARPGVQVVLRVPEGTRKALEVAAQTAGCSMNYAATERLDTGRWPNPRPAKPKPEPGPKGAKKGGMKGVTTAPTGPAAPPKTGSAAS